MKICSKCKETKELSDFAKRGKKRSGHHSHCKSCGNKAAKKRRASQKAEIKIKADNYLERIPKTKCCSRCKVTKSSSEFGIKRHNSDGLNMLCKECARDYDQELYRRNLEKGKKRKRTERAVEYQKEWYAENRERVDEQHREYSQRPEVRERTRLLGRTRYKAIKRLNVAKRRALEKHSLPKWLTQSQKDEMKLLYKQAHTLSEFHEEQYEVDHIEPLNGKKSVGLTVPWNLRVIHWTENRRKGNKLIEELITLT